jgi:hypothetical protein
MPSRISSVSIPSNSEWKITNDASKQSLFDAAVRFVLSGGDPVPGSADKQVSESHIVINLRTNEEIQRGSTRLLAPTVRYGNLCVVDRDEIEGYRSIYQLLRDYLEFKRNKPISIAVFGPPGSGKSFGVREVANEVLKVTGTDSKAVTEPLVFNLAQFSEPDQLSSAFLRIGSEGTGGGVPLAFFDEFDSSLEGNDLGWLRYFLAPMQDGEFFYNGQRQQIGRAILVFAGGTSSSFRSFSREDSNTSEKDKYSFVQAKGPDFISRLSGNINVLGVNRIEGAPDQSYVLRRAVIIRHRLRQMKMLGRTRRAIVDERFLAKLLQVGRYKHGARSIEMILKMCVGNNGTLHLPPPEQLSMHVDEGDIEPLLS